MDKKLLLVDDHYLFVEGLKYLLETYNIPVAGIASNGKEAILMAREIKPDIILMDIMMPEYTGLEVLKIIKAEMEDIKIVMLTASEEEEDLFEALKCGASGYLLKNLEGKELVSMLKGLNRGEVPLSQGLSAKILEEFQRMKNNSRSDEEEEVVAGFQKSLKASKLSPRQLEVIKLIAEGRTYRETAENLNISERTVKYHIGEILIKLHLDNRSQVIAYAARRGFVKNIGENKGN